MKIGIDNYKTGTKNNWRQQCWNEIARRVTDRKNATVLYLAAEQDLDRQVAIRKGFRSNNMIAVDLRQSVVDQLREKNKIAVQGRIEHIACAWGDVDVVYADFCCGFTLEAMKAVEMMCILPFIKEECVFLFNFQRGRESKMAAEWIRQSQENLVLDRNIWIKNPKNRAQLAISYIRNCFYLWDKNISHEIIQKNDHTVVGYIEDCEINGENLTDIVIRKNANPVTISYRSSAAKGLYFDTLILNKPVRSMGRPFTENEKEILKKHGRHIESQDYDKFTSSGQFFKKLKAEFGGNWFNDDLGIFSYVKEIYSVMRKVAAAKAVQTMRKSGTLAPCRNF